jgi:hypothetical protein
LAIKILLSKGFVEAQHLSHLLHVLLRGSPSALNKEENGIPWRYMKDYEIHDQDQQDEGDRLQDSPRYVSVHRHSLL